MKLIANVMFTQVTCSTITLNVTPRISYNRKIVEASPQTSECDMKFMSMSADKCAAGANGDIVKYNRE